MFWYTYKNIITEDYVNCINEKGRASPSVNGSMKKSDVVKSMKVDDEIERWNYWVVCFV